VVVVVAAKNDNFGLGQPQCIAEMIAARIFNERAGTGITEIYGAVTIGSVWQFLRYRGNLVEISGEEYTATQPGKLLGILWQMITGN
jgi:hypothetical protein